MKVFKYVGLVVQSLILLPVTVTAIITLFSGHRESIAVAAMYGGLFLGPWQLVGSLVTSLKRFPFYKWRIIYLVCAIVYLAIIITIAILSSSLEMSAMVRSIGGGVAFAVPALLALFYYFITWKTVLGARTKEVPA